MPAQRLAIEAPVPRRLPPASYHSMASGAVPPPTVAVASPMHTWHSLGVVATLSVTASGSVSVKESDVLQPVASVMVTFHVPAQRFSACDWPCPLDGTGFHT